MGITYGDHLIDSGYYDITPEQEREIEAREECARRGIDPDEICADGGVEVQPDQFGFKADAVIFLTDLIEAQAAELERVTAELDTKLWHWQKRALAAEAALSERTRALEDALTPSAETKAAYMGEFSVPLPEIDDTGEERIRKINVPWTTIKEIMAAIRARAATDAPT